MMTYNDLACEKALRGDLVAGWEKERELATTSLEFKFRLQHSCGSPLSEDVRFWPISANQKRDSM